MFNMGKTQPFSSPNMFLLFNTFFFDQQAQPPVASWLRVPSRLQCIREGMSKSKQESKNTSVPHKFVQKAEFCALELNSAGGLASSRANQPANTGRLLFVLFNTYDKLLTYISKNQTHLFSRHLKVFNLMWSAQVYILEWSSCNRIWVPVQLTQSEV